MESNVLSKGQVVTIVSGRYKGASGIIKSICSGKCLVELNIWGNIKIESIDIKDIEIAEKPSWA